jgi:hypothetical protein
MHNLYPLRYEQAVHAATAAARGETEAVAWSRPSWAGAQRSPGAVVPMGPDMQWVGERPTDPPTVVVTPFPGDGRTELTVPRDAPPAVELVP